MEPCPDGSRSREVVDVGHLGTDGDVASDYAMTSRVTMAALDATAGKRLNLHAGAWRTTRVGS